MRVPCKRPDIQVWANPDEGSNGHGELRPPLGLRPVGRLGDPPGRLRLGERALRRLGVARLWSGGQLQTASQDAVRGLRTERPRVTAQDPGERSHQGRSHGAGHQRQGEKNPWWICSYGSEIFTWHHQMHLMIPPWTLCRTDWWWLWERASSTLSPCCTSAHW